MATTSDLKLLLYRILDHLRNHPAFAREHGIPVDDPAYFREIEELDRMSLQLSLILRDLKSKSHLLQLHAQSLWKVPRAERYASAASVASQQAELQEVMKLAHQVQELLEDLIRRSGLIGEGELAQGIAELIEKFYHQAHTHGEAQHMPDGLAYVPASTSLQGGSVEGLTIFVFVALRAFQYLKKRRKRE